eukprot:1161969-Pelagomonas_calceolata.AAC.12
MLVLLGGRTPDWRRAFCTIALLLMLMLLERGVGSCATCTESSVGYGQGTGCWGCSKLMLCSEERVAVQFVHGQNEGRAPGVRRASSTMMLLLMLMLVAQGVGNCATWTGQRESSESACAPEASGRKRRAGVTDASAFGVGDELLHSVDREQTFKVDAACKGGRVIKGCQQTVACVAVSRQWYVGLSADSGILRLSAESGKCGCQQTVVCGAVSRQWFMGQSTDNGTWGCHQAVVRGAVSNGMWGCRQTVVHGAVSRQWHVGQQKRSY